LSSALVAALLVTISSTAASGLSPRLARLNAWLEAVRVHEPGTADAAARTVAGWTNADVKDVWFDTQALIKFLRCESCKDIAFRGKNGRPIASPYSKFDLLELRKIANEIIERKSDANDLLKRGAFLHGDVAMFTPPDDKGIRDITAAPLQRVVVKGADGQQVSVIDGLMHWETARSLLDLVSVTNDKKPDPARDPTVRLWYRATLAFLQATALHDPVHFARALALFPDDPEVQFQNGCFHETLASPRIQELRRVAEVPSHLVFDVESPRGELEIAERMLRRALELPAGGLPEPAHEARLRLGRVLGLLGRHAEAAGELAQLSAIDDEVLSYYAALFLGAEEEALGRFDEARAAYERAARQQPLAQAPRLALSQLARRHGDRTAALQAIQPLLALSGAEADRSDPWWFYHAAEGRRAWDLLEELYRPFHRGAP
jgi:tetratricopeptide (TPR) repeat protein